MSQKATENEISFLIISLWMKYVSLNGMIKPNIFHDEIRRLDCYFLEISILDHIFFRKSE